MENIVKFSKYDFKVEEGNQAGYKVDELKGDVTSGLGTAKKVDAISTKVSGKAGKDMGNSKLNNTLANTPIKPFNKKTDVVQDVPVTTQGTATSTPVKTFDNFFKTSTESSKGIKDKKDLANKL